MLLLYVYVASLIVGGILLGASVLFGHGAHHDVDVDHDVELGAEADLATDAGLDADVGGDIDADADVAQAEVSAGEAVADAGAHGDLELSDFWLPFLSMRFWVFFLCFFGLTGAILTLVALSGRGVTLAMAIAVGVVTGFAAAFIVNRLRRAEIGAVAQHADFHGLEGDVLLAIQPGSQGKVRVTLRGRVVDLIATGDDESGAIERGDRVLVIGMRDHVARVVRAPDV